MIVLWFAAAAFFEIVGCWLMLQFIGQKTWEFAAGSVLSLIVFAVIVSVVDLGLSGRTYAAYGGIYIATALAWFLLVDKGTLTMYDVIGVTCSIFGAGIILLGHFSKI